MNDMTNKILDFAFPIAGGAGGSLLSVITIGGLIQTAVSALVFALVGGIVGWGIKLLLDNIYKKFKKNV